MSSDKVIKIPASTYFALVKLQSDLIANGLDSVPKSIRSRIPKEIMQGGITIRLTISLATAALSEVKDLEL